MPPNKIAIFLSRKKWYQMNSRPHFFACQLTVFRISLRLTMCLKGGALDVLLFPNPLPQLPKPICAYPRNAR
jgi:hypothetical protein